VEFNLFDVTVAFKHKKSFDELEFHDTKYANELGNGVGLCSNED